MTRAAIYKGDHTFVVEDVQSATPGPGDVSIVPK